MIVRLNNQHDLRELRLKLYKDEVFMFSNEILDNMLDILNIVELFASSEAFANYLIANAITDKNCIKYEVEDLENEITSEKDMFLLLSITFIKLCALRKSHPIAIDVAKSLVEYCTKYENFIPLLKALDNKEHKLPAEKRADLLKYRLRTIEHDNPPLEEAKEVIKNLIETIEKMTADSIERLIAPLSIINQQYNNAFEEDINKLYSTLEKKTTTRIQIDKINDIHDNDTVSIGG